MLNDLWTRLVGWTGTLVSPDWGALVALIPVLLAVVVGAFIVITGAKWAGAGPTRRGPGRRPPLAPDGTPSRSPSLAPVAVAAGAFLLVFGLVAGGPALGAGVVATALALGWWAWDLRPAARGGRASSPGDAGSGAVPTATRAAAAPRRVTPLRAGAIGAAVLAVAVLAATTRVVPDAPATGRPAASSTALAGSDAPSLPAADVTLTAQNIAFVETALTAPAGRPFTVAFDNLDNAPHNLEIRDSGGTVLFRGDIVTGPAVTVYAVPALPAGTYPFICTVHPAMTGTLTAK